jgi:hypothetical protein
MTQLKGKRQTYGLTQNKTVSSARYWKTALKRNQKERTVEKQKRLETFHSSTHIKCG